MPGMGRSPGVLLVPGVGASFLGVGVLDLRPGVEDLSFWGEKGWKTRDELQLPGSRVPAPVTPQKGRTWPRSLVLEEGVLLEEATEAGLLGASPFFSPRALSRPFSGGMGRAHPGGGGVLWDGKGVGIPTARRAPSSSSFRPVLGSP